MRKRPPLRNPMRSSPSAFLRAVLPPQSYEPFSLRLHFPASTPIILNSYLRIFLPIWMALGFSPETGDLYTEKSYPDILQYGGAAISQTELRQEMDGWAPLHCSLYRFAFV
ncbi:hypothetical protein K402DRAFT_269510 [Aulographum hederae CBS 113979]|uniref:Uncharacterized protein n=1 Tax=Aulographum hederae CBS 113979 TaxID=1176131 RepID=A0A6G1H8A8_9PEZI|nr:hypothetical protein K402DRAFT_269510 [Aulographum hederae CBS 113979]